MTTLLLLLLIVTPLDAVAYQRGEMIVALAPLLRRHPALRELMTSFMLYLQFLSDHTAPDTHYRSHAYQQSWRDCEFDDSHYDNMTRPPLEDYFVRNKASHYTLVDSIASHFWIYVENDTLQRSGPVPTAADPSTIKEDL